MKVAITTSRMKMPSETIRSLKMLSGQKRSPRLSSRSYRSLIFFLFSSFIISLVFFAGEVGLTMLDNEIEMYADQADQDSGKQPDMGGEEALQGQRAQVRAAAQGLENEFADEGDRSCDL